MAYEAPTAGTGQSVLEHEYRGDGVLGIIQMGTVGAIAMRTGDYSEYLLKDVQLVRRKVIEVAASGNIGLQAPWQLFRCRIVKVTGRNGEPYLHVDDFSQCSLVDNLFGFLEIWQVAAVVSHKAWYARLL